MYKKILVPTDASEYSKRAFNQAINLAKQFQSEIIVLHVTYSPQAYWGYTVSYGISVTREDLTRNGQVALEATLAGISTYGIKIDTVLEMGNPVNRILDYVHKEKIDLIVMGSHGYGPILGPLLGSVSQRVLQKAPCPVLFVK
jgi:nucleotide-binding universal stress UspA family protein